MQVEGTRAAFEVMISERGIYKRLGVERSTVATWKIYLREGKSISLDKMEEMLIRGGATVAHEKVWALSKPSDIIFDNEKDFNLALRYLRPGKSISIDLAESVHQGKVENWMIKFAQDHSYVIEEDQSKWPIVTYTCVEKKV